MPAAEIIEKGKAEGYDLTPALVYKVRSAAKHQDKSAKAEPAKAKGGRKAAAPKKAEPKKAEPKKAEPKKAEPKKPAARKAKLEAKKPEAKKSEDKLGTLSEFIRNLPVDMSPEEVVTKGAAAGLSLTASYVRRIRRRMDKKAAKPVAAPKVEAKKPEAKKPEAAKKPVPAAPAKKAPAAEGPDDVLFRQLVVNIGLPRAKVLLGEVENKLDALISGR
jgi:hypothetical protein